MSTALRKPNLKKKTNNSNVMLLQTPSRTTLSMCNKVTRGQCYYLQKIHKQ